jgi:hypothetical protein
MEEPAMSLTAQDRLAVHELVSLHGHLADDRQTHELDRLLTEDAVYDLADYGMGQVIGLPALRRLFEQAPGEQPLGHHVTNIVITENADASAQERTKGLAVMATGAAGTVVYHDHAVRTPAGWRIAHRKVIRR